jgi:hypothetical protein
MESGRREDVGQAVEELESGQTQRCSAGQVGRREEIEDLVGVTADEVESVEGKRGPGAIPNEPLEAGAVGSLNPDAPIQTESAAVIPGEHVVGLVGFEEAVALEMPEDPGADRVLKALQELVGEGDGLVETEASDGVVWILDLVTHERLEEPIDHAHVVVKVRVQRRAEAMEEADSPETGGGRCGGAGFSQGCPEGPEEDVKDGAGGPGPVVEVRPQTLGNGEDELAHGYVGDDVVHQVGRRLGHALRSARGTRASGLARESDQELKTTTRAPSPRESVGQDAALQIAPKLLFHVIRHTVAHGVGLVGQGEVGLQVFPDDAVQRGGLGAAPAIGLSMGAGRWPGW